MRRTILLGALLLLAASHVGVAQTAPTLEALRLEEGEAIALDGRIDDLAWQRAEVGSNLIQREPSEGASATERTEFRVAYNDRVLFVAIRLFDSSPDRIVAMEMERDAQLFGDDSVAFLLDTFFDRRNAYVFETNPNGVRTDVLVADEGREVTPEWDGVWNVATERDAEGWSAEFAIPFATLRFDPGADAWGFSVRRLIRHKNEEVNWTPLSRGLGSPRDPSLYAFHRVSLAGTLTGIRDVRQARALDITPFLVASATENQRTDVSDDDVELGLDVKWAVTRNLSLDLTYNTDFAETEVDEQQVNLTRFSLFFPEKRDFFLENAGIFEFGLPNRNPSSPGLMKLFFSRRIGLDAGRQIPIVGGVRLTGRAGNWNIGVLDVVTDEEDAGTTVVGTTNFGVIRIKRNIGRRSGIGLLLTDRDESGASRNTVYGVDVDYKPTDRVDFAAFAAVSRDDSTTGDDWSAGLSGAYIGRDVSATFEHTVANEGFVPGTGFLLRTDFERTHPRIVWRPRIEKYGIRTWFAEASLDRYEKASLGELESQEVSLSAVGMRSMNDDGWGLNWVHETEVLFTPFEISDGIVIPPGRYEFSGWRLGGRSNPGRFWQLRGRVQSGNFFEGDRSGGNVSLGLRFSRFFRTSSSIGYFDVKLPQGDFTTGIYGQRLSFSFTPTMRLNAFVQYNDTTELIGANVRFNWIYRPGADLFVVYNQNWTAPTFRSRVVEDRQVIVKLTYLFR